MSAQNLAAAAIFDEIADRLAIQGENAFRVRAYDNAARMLQGLGPDVKQKLERGEDLTELPGIGADLADKIREIVETGKCSLLEKLRGEMPAAVTELLKVPGLGPKRVALLWHDLDVQTPEQVLRAARDGRIRTLPRFGEKVERQIEAAVAAQLSVVTRMKLVTAAQYADALVRHLERVQGVDRVAVAGSFRRMKETVADLDLLVTARKANVAMERFVAYPEVADVLAQGETRASVRLKSGLQVDLRVVAAKDFGAAICYFTGSKAHSIALRRIAQQRGLKINEYGVFSGAKRIAGDTETSVYRAIGLHEIAPELREDRGEIEAARAGRLPSLVESANLKGDLHARTNATDGRNSLEEMAAAAQMLGFEYLAIAEPSRRASMPQGLDSDRIRRQGELIDRLNAKSKGLRLLKGIEVDILDDGRLDLPDSVLAELDVVVAAVHSRFDLSRAQQTERILRALDNPHVTLLAQPNERLIGEAGAFDVDMLKIVRKAKAQRVYLELTAHPERLDLIDKNCRMAKDEGVLVAIASDAHDTGEFINLRFGVGQARRGWLTRDDVLNARGLRELLPLLARERVRPRASRAKAHAA
ncbi:MAG: DNA polymerase/3'-5' exonuclease PolX [Betaproteobacteria bacterium]|nr:MAG: DNA polymerase/3'-5' exonuclease PolX [Betaproteobacteria bacterium]